MVVVTNGLKGEFIARRDASANEHRLSGWRISPSEDAATQLLKKQCSYCEKKKKKKNKVPLISCLFRNLLFNLSGPLQTGMT